MRARLANLWRRVFPHPTSIARRERRRVARDAARISEPVFRQRRDAMTARLRAEIKQRSS